MKKIILLFLFVSLFIITTFFLFSDLETFVEERLDGTYSGVTYFFLSFTFLFYDILLPVPSSLIMLLNGKYLGVLGGGILSFAAGWCSSWLGFVLGRKSSRLVNRFFREEDIHQGNRFYDKYGKIAVSLSRALPVLSESVSVVSGATQMPQKTFLIYAAIGHLIVSFLYAFLGATMSDYNGNMITVIIVIATLLLSWLVSLLQRQRAS